MATELTAFGITFSNGDTLTNLPGGMGGATWHDVLASRAKNTTYTNTTGKQLWVSISASATAFVPILVEGYTIFTINANGYMQSFLFCVNKGSQYSWGSTNGTFFVWKELYI